MSTAESVLLVVFIFLPYALLIVAGVLYLNHDRKKAEKYIKGTERLSRRRFHP